MQFILAKQQVKTLPLVIWNHMTIAGRIWIASSLLTMGQLEVDKTIELG